MYYKKFNIFTCRIVSPEIKARRNLIDNYMSATEVL